MTPARAARLAAPLLALIVGCGGGAPATRHYQLAAPAPAPAPADDRGDLVIAIEPFAVEDAYQDERIVYRTSPYRLDYYHYHRWSAPPGVLIAGYLEQALEQSGRFRAVVREPGGATAVLGGRVVAIEEVDESRTRWLGRIVLELTLEDARTGALLWTEQLAETEPLAAQSPEGLARALSAAMARIAARAIPEIAAHAGRAARSSAAAPDRGKDDRNWRNMREILDLSAAH